MKRKLKKLIGQAIVYSIFFCYWAFLQGMTY